MCISASGRSGKYDERPEPCRSCGAVAWWNGIRRVAQVLFDAATQLVKREHIDRRRARCSLRNCPAGSWTVYEETGYPHRSFQLPVVASAVAEMAFAPNATMTGVALQYQCDRRSIGRWVLWVSSLDAAGELARTVARLEPDGLPPPKTSAFMTKPAAGAGAVLRLLDTLTEILRHRGVDLGSARPGLMAILRQQMRRFGEIFYLMKSSPPLRMDGGPATD